MGHITTVQAYELDGLLYRTKKEAVIDFRARGLKELTNGMNVYELFRELVNDEVFKSQFIRILESDGSIYD